MTGEQEWINSFVNLLNDRVRQINPKLRVSEGRKLPYAFEILNYNNEEVGERSDLKYETDLLVWEILEEERWKPRIIIECKLGRITTHDAITYSQKAKTHKNVHPYLRYGILIGNREHYPLPGRLFRHGENFDFMLSWVHLQSTKTEWNSLIDLVKMELNASKDLEEIIFHSRSPKREHYTFLHKRLELR